MEPVVLVAVIQVLLQRTAVEVVRAAKLAALQRLLLARALAVLTAVAVVAVHLSLGLAAAEPSASSGASVAFAAHHPSRLQMSALREP
jgi:hypothetical protein